MSSIHERLVHILKNEFKGSLQADPEFLYDGVRVKLKNGTELQIIYPLEEEYVFSWETDGNAWRIDTAPLHKEISTFPNHLHCGDEIKADELTDIKKSPEDNLRSVIKFISG